MKTRIAENQQVGLFFGFQAGSFVYLRICLFGMKRFLIFSILFCLTLQGKAQWPYFEWCKQIGGTSGEIAKSIVHDALGNSYVAGEYSSWAVDFDPGVGTFNMSGLAIPNAFILKLDPAGDFVWAKSLSGGGSGPNVIFANSITIDDNGDIYVTGEFHGTIDFDPGVGIYNLSSDATFDPQSNDIFVLKINNLGNFLWAKKLGNSHRDHSQIIKADDSGNVYITGYLNEYTSATFSVYRDIFITKLDSSGNLVWEKLISGTSMGGGTSLAIFNNSVYLCGNFYGTFDFDPGTAIFNMMSSNGNCFILKLNNLGNFVWSKQVGGGAGNPYSYSITSDLNGNVFYAGGFDGTVDFDPGFATDSYTSLCSSDAFISKIDSSGNYDWTVQMQGTPLSYSLVSSIVLDQDGFIYSYGSYKDTVDFAPGSDTANFFVSGNTNVFLSKLDVMGSFVWAKVFSGDYVTNSTIMSLDVSKNIYTVGLFVGTTDFDPDIATYSLTSDGSTYSDLFINKLSQGPNDIHENYLSQNIVSLFPNPTTNNLTIETTKPTNISIVNLLGQEIFHSKIKRSEIIDVSFLSNGIYFVKDLQNGGSIKFVKQ